MAQQVEQQRPRGRWQDYDRDYSDEDLGVNERQNFPAPRYQNENNPPGGGRGYARGDYNQPGDPEIGDTRFDPQSGQGYAKGDYGQGYYHPPSSGRWEMNEVWESPQRSRDYGRGEARDYPGQRESWGAFPQRPGAPYSRDWWLAPGPFQGKGPQGWTRSTERIREDICERMTQHGQLEASHIQVDVKDDQVTLSGTVSSRFEKRLAEEVAESVWGVSDVNNQLRLSHSGNGDHLSTFDRDK